jgi:hypothetical protein
MIFDLLLLKDWLREAVYTEDKSTFLYWHHVIDVTTILNDDATNSEFFQQIINGDPKLAVGAAKGPGQVRFGGVGRKKWAVQPGVPKLQGEINLALPQPRQDLNFGGAIDPGLLQNVPGAIAPGTATGAPGEAKGTNVVAPHAIGRPKGPGKQFGPNVEKPGADKPFKINPPFLNFRKAPVQRVKHTIPTTDIEMRNRLNQPRKPLAVWLYTGVAGAVEYILQSPQLNATVDAMHGPICTIMDCDQIDGQMTSVMHLRFETWEAPPIKYGPIPTAETLTSLKSLEGGGAIFKGIAGLANQRPIITPAVLSHRWNMSFGWNQDTHLRTKTIEGEVIFRSDVLQLRGLSADQLRPYFMAHGISQGFIRRPLNEKMIMLNSGGNGVQYVVIDDEQMTNFPGGNDWGIIKMEAESQVTYQSSQVFEEAVSKKIKGGGMWDSVKEWIEERWDKN